MISHHRCVLLNQVKGEEGGIISVREPERSEVTRLLIELIAHRETVFALSYSLPLLGWFVVTLYAAAYICIH